MSAKDAVRAREQAKKPKPVEPPKPKVPPPDDIALDEFAEDLTDDRDG